ncbi:MAG TPA: hypothetical protein PLB64_00480 [Kiritimatiellia bacterium]|nr:hypothetical protein [Kiritimatiellia bacterium]
MFFQISFHAVQHPDAFAVSLAEAGECFLGFIFAQMGHVKVVNSFGGFAAAAVDTFDFVAHVAVIILFGQLGGRAVGRPPDLRAQFVFFLGRPAMRKIGDFQVKLAESLINDQIFHIPEFSHSVLLLTSEI